MQTISFLTIYIWSTYHLQNSPLKKMYKVKLLIAEAVTRKPKTCNFSKKELHLWCIPESFEEFFRTSIL